MTNVAHTPLPALPPREATSHKGDFGRAMIVGGSRGMSGAPAMAGMSCLRSGAGLVTVATPESSLATVAAFCPAFTTQSLVEDDYGRAHWANAFDLQAQAEDFDAWAIGPGLGSPESLSSLVARVYSSWRQPVVVDADGLNALAVHEELFGPVLNLPAGPRVLTPHPGEFARLARDSHLAELATGEDYQRVEAAAELAHRDDTSQTVVVLKGHRTVVTDGDRYAVNSTGNPGMASGGSGDVLTGVIMALVCQGLASFDAARLGVYVHGLAGDLAADALGQVSLMATDLIDHLPQAFLSLPANE